MSIDVLKRHMAKPYIMELVDSDGRKDEIEIKPLKGKYLVEMMLLLKDINSLGIDTKTKEELAKLTPEEMQKYEADEGMKFFNNMTKGMLERLDTLITASLKESFPTADDAVIDGFKMSHPFDLFMAVMKCNTPAISVK